MNEIKYQFGYGFLSQAFIYSHSKLSAITCVTLLLSVDDKQFSCRKSWSRNNSEKAQSVKDIDGDESVMSKQKGRLQKEIVCVCCLLKWKKLCFRGGSLAHTL